MTGIPPGDPFFHALVDTSPNPYVVVDHAGCVRYASSTIVDLLGIPADDLVGRSFLELLPPEAQQIALAAYNQFVSPDRELRPWLGPGVPLDLLHADGSRVPVDVGGVAPAGSRIDAAVFQLKRARGVRLLDSAVDAVLMEVPLADALGHVVHLVEHDLPPSSVTIGWGWDGSTFASTTDGAGAPALDVFTGACDVAATPWGRALRENEPTCDGDLSAFPDSLRRELERRGIAACWTFPVPVAPGLRPNAVVIVWRHVPGPTRIQLEVTANRATRLVGLALDYRGARERWQHEARTDGLTGLANRAALADHLATLVAEPTGFEPFAVLYCDLDGFKPVNDRYSHTVGDAVLTLVAKRVRESVRPSDFVARLGGDEIAVVCRPASDPTPAVAIADRVIEAVNAPLRVDGHAIRLGVSVGIAFAGEPVPAGSLLHDADRALLSAKAAGKNRWALAS